MRSSRRCVQPAESEPNAKSSLAQGDETAPPDSPPGPIAIRHRGHGRSPAAVPNKTGIVINSGRPDPTDWPPMSIAYVEKFNPEQRRARRSRPWGSSGRAPVWTAGPPFRDSVISAKRPVYDRGPDLQHQMGAPGRPAHVLLCVHSPVQQPLFGTFRDRRRNRLVLVPRRGVVDDDIGLSTNICLEIAHQTRHLAGGHSGQFVAVGDNVERDERFANEIEGPSDLAVPQAPAKPIDDFNEICNRLAIVRGDGRPAFGRLINMVNPHQKMEPVKYMTSRARTGRFAERMRTFRPSLRIVTGVTAVAPNL